MTILDGVAITVGVIVGCGAAKRYAKDMFPENFFYEPKHMKKSTIRRWLERVFFLILGGE